MAGAGFHGFCWGEADGEQDIVPGTSTDERTVRHGEGGAEEGRETQKAIGVCVCCLLAGWGRAAGSNEAGGSPRTLKQSRYTSAETRPGWRVFPFVEQMKLGPSHFRGRLRHEVARSRASRASPSISRFRGDRAHDRPLPGGRPT